jgi:circadian clock protein KaiB
MTHPLPPVEQQLYRLYVSSASPVSSRAVVNARRFFERHLPGQHRLHVLDIATHVASARDDQIIASPTLIRMSPLPRRRFIGDMSDTARLRESLGLVAPVEE